MFLRFGAEPLQMLNRELALASWTAARAAAVSPDRFPKTIRSSKELPINRLRPCRPPEASPATKRFFTFVSEFVSIFTPPF